MHSRRHSKRNLCYAFNEVKTIFSIYLLSGCKIDVPNQYISQFSCSKHLLYLKISSEKDFLHQV